MKKTLLFIILALTATALLGIKTTRLLNVRLPENTLFLTTGFRLFTTTAGQSSSSDHTDYNSERPNRYKMEQAIRRQLDADAAQTTRQQNASETARQIAEIYTRMSAQKAARIMETMPVPQIILLLQLMETEKASVVLSLMNPDTARIVTTQMLQK